MVDPSISQTINSYGLFNFQDVRVNILTRTLKTIRYAFKDQKAKSRIWWRLCTSVDFLRMSHAYFFKNQKELLSSSARTVPLPSSRFSINVIAFDTYVMKKISEAIGEEFSMNDEEIISNKFPIVMISDFLACHLHFADQRANLPDHEEDELLRQYESLANNIIRTQLN